MQLEICLYFYQIICGTVSIIPHPPSRLINFPFYIISYKDTKWAGNIQINLVQSVAGHKDF